MKINKKGRLILDNQLEMLRKKVKSIIHILFFTLLIYQSGFSQIQWSKYSGNPVLIKDTTLIGIWEWAGIGQPSCILDNDTFKMYYVAAGVQFLGDTVLRGRISYAYSIDGINWIKSDSILPVLDVDTAGGWDSEWLDAPEILMDPGGYKLYYFGNSNYDEVFNPPPVSSAYGVAISTDGINWQKYENNPILEKGNTLDWDGLWVESPALYYDAQTGKYMMWYTGIASNYEMRIGLSTSTDGIIWTKDTINNPVVDIGISGSWDDLIVGVPAVIKSGYIFEMWYNGCQIPYGLDTIKIGYAVSINGIDWLKYPGNPVLSINDPPNDSNGPWAPDVIFDSINNEYKMWYETEFEDLTIFLATAPRTILYSDSCYTAISSDTTINQGDSITIIASGGTFYHWHPSEGLSNPNIANPSVSIDSTITYTVLIVGDSCITTETITITVIPLSIDNVEKNLNSNIKIFLNTDNKIVTIILEDIGNKLFTAEIIDINGQIIYNKQLIKPVEQIDLSHYSKGIYFIKVKGYSAQDKSTFINEVRKIVVF